MKANELMVGDFVMMGKKIYRCANICGHTNDVLLDNGVITNVGNLSPIHLTSEILKKNGFENYKNIGSLSYYKNKDNNLEFEFYGKTLEDYAGNRIIELGYVHELQHALKLCGIDKTIEL